MTHPVVINEQDRRPLGIGQGRKGRLHIGHARATSALSPTPTLLDGLPLSALRCPAAKRVFAQIGRNAEHPGPERLAIPKTANPPRSTDEGLLGHVFAGFPVAEEPAGKAPHHRIVGIEEPGESNLVPRPCKKHKFGVWRVFGL